MKLRNRIIPLVLIISLVIPLTVNAATYSGGYDLSANHDVNLYYNNQEATANNRKIIWKELRSWGLTEAGVAGVMGNMANESGFDPTRTQNNVPWSAFKFGTTGLGLTQWTYWTRQEKLFNTANEIGKQWNTFEAQFATLQSELSSGYDILRTSDNIQECTSYFLRNYEKPAVYNLAERTASAEAVYRELTGTEPEAYNGGDSSSTSSSEEKTVEVSAIVDEWDLIGMPTKNKISDGASSVKLHTRDDLSIGESYSVQKVKEDIALSKEVVTYDNARIAIVFVGLLLILYAVFMLLALIFDKANQFIDISLIKVITFGALEYSDEEETKGMKGYASTSKVFISSACICIVGLLIVSGGVLPFLMNVVYSVTQRFM